MIFCQIREQPIIKKKSFASMPVPLRPMSLHTFLVLYISGQTLSLLPPCALMPDPCRKSSDCSVLHPVCAYGTCCLSESAIDSPYQFSRCHFRLAKGSCKVTSDCQQGHTCERGTCCQDLWHYFFLDKWDDMSQVTRNFVFRGLQPGKSQTGLFS